MAMSSPILSSSRDGDFIASENLTLPSHPWSSGGYRQISPKMSTGCAPSASPHRRDAPGPLVSLHWSLASWSMLCQAIYVKQEECKPGHRSGSLGAGVWSFVVRRGLTCLQMFQVPSFEALQVLCSAGCIQTALLNLCGHTGAFTGSNLILICAFAMHMAWGSCD